MTTTTMRRYSSHTLNDPAKVTKAKARAAPKTRTIHPGTVRSADEMPRLLVSGHNQRKLGARVEKGAWAGMPIYALTLEERATCPASCAQWSTCYGNGMPLANRAVADDRLVYWLDRELEQLNRQHRRGFVVRLHILGDFFSAGYVAAWAGWLDRFPALRVFGYTAWPRGTQVGDAVHALARARWDRFAVRLSVEAPGAHLGEVITVWKKPELVYEADGIVCPAQTGATDCCGTCGLCWSPTARDKRIVFIGHGAAKGRPIGSTRATDRRRADAVLALLTAAADAGRRSPTNEEIAAEVGLKAGGHASMVVTALARKGLIRVERFQAGRIVTIVETGRSTSFTGSRAPHWRDLAFGGAHA